MHPRRSYAIARPSPRQLRERFRPHQRGASTAMNTDDRRTLAVLLVLEPDAVDVGLGHDASLIPPPVSAHTRTRHPDAPYHLECEHAHDAAPAHAKDEDQVSSYQTTQPPIRGESGRSAQAPRTVALGREGSVSSSVVDVSLGVQTTRSESACLSPGCFSHVFRSMGFSHERNRSPPCPGLFLWPPAWA